MVKTKKSKEPKPLAETVYEKLEEEKAENKSPSLKDVMDMKITKEEPVGYVKLDVEMSKSLEDFLLDYAVENMPRKTKQDLFIEWAFVDLLEKRLDKEIPAKVRTKIKEARK